MTKSGVRVTLLAILLCTFASAVHADVSVDFSFGVVNTTAGNETFTYAFSTPFSGGPYTQIQTIFVDVLINTAFAGTENVAPNGGPDIMNTYVDGVLVPGLGRGTGCTTAPSPLFFCQSGAIGGIGPVPYLSPATGTLEVSGSFVLSPNTSYTLTGNTELLSPAPEASALELTPLMLLAVGGVGFLRRRSHRIDFRNSSKKRNGDLAGRLPPRLH
ncbi:MAG: hypothetical protein WBW33_11670 [Bryobacteraceae bacterium]